MKKEKPKQDLEKEMFKLEQELNIQSNLRWHNSKPKQETLEEVAENYTNEFYSSYAFKNLVKPIFIDGAKWQQERMYSEEDMKKAFYQGSTNSLGLEWGKNRFDEWFEEFKNKQL